MKVTAKLLEDCSNMFGKISPQIQKRIKKYLKNPTFDTWDDIQSIIISSSRWTTVWQAVIAIDPLFPRTGRITDIDNNIAREWSQIPDPFTVVRAIKGTMDKE